ncbi:MAG TPA: hypothetical protein DIV79_00925, partial [Opitutae bacterium]|nr:hypothetical protein [Opitutae bacterium]
NFFWGQLMNCDYGSGEGPTPRGGVYLIVLPACIESSNRSFLTRQPTMALVASKALNLAKSLDEYFLSKRRTII